MGTVALRGAGTAKTAVTSMAGSACRPPIRKLPIAPQPITATFNAAPQISTAETNFSSPENDGLTADLNQSIGSPRC
jgi:hypothetical protein